MTEEAVDDCSGCAVYALVMTPAAWPPGVRVPTPMNPSSTGDPAIHHSLQFKEVLYAQRDCAILAQVVLGSRLKQHIYESFQRPRLIIWSRADAAIDAIGNCRFDLGNDVPHNMRLAEQCRYAEVSACVVLQLLQLQFGSVVTMDGASLWPKQNFEFCSRPHRLFPPSRPPPHDAQIAGSLVAERHVGPTGARRGKHLHRLNVLEGKLFRLSENNSGPDAISRCACNH